MIEYSDINDLISIATAIIYFISKEINILIIILLWYHLIRGIVMLVMEYVLWESYFSIDAIIDLTVGMFVFLRDYQISQHVLYFFMILLLIKSSYNIFSPFDNAFGEE